MVTAMVLATASIICKHEQLSSCLVLQQDDTHVLIAGCYSQKTMDAKGMTKGFLMGGKSFVKDGVRFTLDKPSICTMA